MRKNILILFLLFIPYLLFSQEIVVKEIQKISLSEAAYFPSFGKSDDQLLLTSANYKGLKLYDLSTQELTNITNAPGAGSNPQFTPSGDLLVSEFEYIKGRKNVNYKLFSSSGEEKIALKSAPGDVFPKVSVKGKEIIISYDADNIVKFSPVGDYYYIWPSFSPDNGKILFTAAGKGTYVMNTEGEVIQELGYLNAPLWINNQWVTGMADEDNGTTITESDVIAVHVSSGKKYNLTEDYKVVATYPEPSSGAEKIVFHSPQGEVYVMNIEIKE